MNELALLFERLGIDTLDVLEAAGTKWNFLPFRPGLVGGHCIGVDPYYLTHKAEEVGYIPQVILAGRRINDGMGAFIANRTIREMTRAGHPVSGTPVTVLGLTFKEDCPDLRNSRVIDIIRELQDFGAVVQVADPLADPEEALHEYGVTLTPFDQLAPAAAVVAAVSHREYRALAAADLLALCLRPAGRHRRQGRLRPRGPRRRRHPALAALMADDRLLRRKVANDLRTELAQLDAVMQDYAGFRRALRRADGPVPLPRRGLVHGRLLPVRRGDVHEHLRRARRRRPAGPQLAQAAAREHGGRDAGRPPGGHLRPSCSRR